MTYEETKFFDLTTKTVLITVSTRRDTRPRHYIRDEDQDQDSENTVSRESRLSRDETVSHDFPSLYKCRFILQVL